MKEGDQERIAALVRHPLQGLAGGPPGDLGQALEPIGTQAVEGPSRDPRPLQEFELLDVAQDGLPIANGPKATNFAGLRRNLLSLNDNRHRTRGRRQHPLTG
jgi:hypothetical protein